MLDFKRVWLVDFEFGVEKGGRPVPICMVALELYTGRCLRVWLDGPDTGTVSCPFDSQDLYVAYYASAELGCHLVLGWPMPANILDLFVEFRNLTNGLTVPCGNGLIGAMAFFGLDSIGVEDKDEMRTLALRGGPWTAEEQEALLVYCEGDVRALAKLIEAMESHLDIPRGLLRGRYMASAAHIEYTGVPIDALLLSDLRRNWAAIMDELVGRVDADFGVYEGKTFKIDRWSQWLQSHDIAWPRLASGTLALDDATFKQMAQTHPGIAPIRELRITLSQMRLSDLSVGVDGRNRCLLSAFRARTGRNQPSNSKFIYGPAVWLRGLIRPEKGSGLAYIDWEQQEFGIAAALSGDANMLAAYNSGDPYLAFAKQAGAAPREATKNSHGAIREQFKAAALAVQYGMGEQALAGRIGCPRIHAKHLLQQHHTTYRDFWRWSDAAVDHAMIHGRLHTVFGWTIHVGADPNPRSLRNFPMQANGAEVVPGIRTVC
jgi:DNA polymerase I